jgi:hypothetical protein
MRYRTLPTRDQIPVPFEKESFINVRHFEIPVKLKSRIETDSSNVLVKLFQIMEC